MTPCKIVMFDVAIKGGIVENGYVLRCYVTDVSKGVPERYITSDGFLTLGGIVRHQDDQRASGPAGGIEGDGMMSVQPAEELLGQEDASRERSGHYPFEPAKSLKFVECFFWNLIPQPNATAVILPPVLVWIRLSISDVP